MREITRYSHGQPCWADLGTPDFEGAQAFYGTLFGWEFAPSTADPGIYLHGMLDGRPVAGLHRMPAGQRNAGRSPYWSTYLATPDLAATLVAVARSGGQVLVPITEVGQDGSLAVVTDTARAIVGLWQGRQHVGGALADMPGTVCWSELLTKDVQTAVSFYAKVFGAVPEESPLPVEHRYVLLCVDGQSVAGVMAMPPDLPDRMPPCWNTYFAVDDVDECVESTQAAGGHVLRPAHTTPWGRFAVLADPAGAVFNVVTRAEA